MKEVLCFLHPKTIISNYITHEKSQDGLNWVLGKIACVRGMNCTRALHLCDVTASIRDLYCFYPWKKTSSRTNYSGKCRDRIVTARGLNYPKRWKQPCDLCCDYKCMRSQICVYERAAKLALQWHSLLHADKPMKQSKQHGERQKIAGGSLALCTCFNRHSANKQMCLCMKRLFPHSEVSLSGKDPALDLQHC